MTDTVKIPGELEPIAENGYVANASKIKCQVDGNNIAQSTLNTQILTSLANKFNLPPIVSSKEINSIKTVNANGGYDYLIDLTVAGYYELEDVTNLSFEGTLGGDTPTVVVFKTSDSIEEEAEITYSESNEDLVLYMVNPYIKSGGCYAVIAWRNTIINIG